MQMCSRFELSLQLLEHYSSQLRKFSFAVSHTKNNFLHLPNVMMNNNGDKGQDHILIKTIKELIIMMIFQSHPYFLMR